MCVWLVIWGGGGEKKEVVLNSMVCKQNTNILIAKLISRAQAASHRGEKDVWRTGNKHFHRKARSEKTAAPKHRPSETRHFRFQDNS